jgi:hypothetical protein
MVPPTPEALEAVRQPPSCISGFDYTSEAISIAAEFALRCKNCQHNVFRILAFPMRVPDPSPYYDLSPGEMLHRPPHRLRCTSCGAEAPLFDIRKDGYDGVFGNATGYESGEEGEAPIPGEHNVVVAFLYNIELTELRQLAAEANVNPSDLFDSFNVVGTPASSREPVHLDYECA